MLTALLPGFREFRTPLATGALWVASAWVLFGSHVASSDVVYQFAEKFYLGELPKPAWYAVAVLSTFLVGNLLVVERDPHRLISKRFRSAVAALVDRCEPRVEQDLAEGGSRTGLPWQVRRTRAFRTLERVRDEERGEIESNPALAGWVNSQFNTWLDRGRFPVMWSYPGHCEAPVGFRAFYAASSIDNDNDDLRWELEGQLRHQISRERAEVEVRIQMRFPEVYSEIDRLKEEARLRASLYWPLIALSVMLSREGIWIALAGIPVAVMLLVQGTKRAGEAVDKTWAPLIAGEVTSPVLDAMAERVKDGEARDFRKEFGDDLADGENYRAINAGQESHSEPAENSTT